MAGDNNSAGARRDLLTHTAQALFRKRASHWMTEHPVFYIHSFWRIFSLGEGGRVGRCRKWRIYPTKKHSQNCPSCRNWQERVTRQEGGEWQGAHGEGGGGRVERQGVSTSRHGGVREERGQDGERGREERGKGSSGHKTSRIRSLPDIAMKHDSGELRRYRTWSRCCLTSSTVLSDLLCGSLTVSRHLSSLTQRAPRGI
jgi:hypothetical protein